MKKIPLFLITIVFLIFLFAFVVYYSRNMVLANKIDSSLIIKIIDGDIIQLSDGKIVDLAGVYIAKKGEINYREELVDNIDQLLVNQKVKIETVERKNVDYPEYDLVEGCA